MYERLCRVSRGQGSLLFLPHFIPFVSAQCLQFTKKNNLSLIWWMCSTQLFKDKWPLMTRIHWRLSMCHYTVKNEEKKGLVLIKLPFCGYCPLSAIVEAIFTYQANCCCSRLVVAVVFCCWARGCGFNAWPLQPYSNGGTNLRTLIVLKFRGTLKMPRWLK